MKSGKKEPERLHIPTRLSCKKGTVRGKELRQKEFLKLYPGNLYNITQTAKDIGVSRRVIYQWLETDEDFQETMNDMKESRLDAVESKLFEKAVSGDIISCIFFLKCQGKARGYVEQPNKQYLEISQGPKFDKSQLDAVVRGANIDRAKYAKMLGIQDT